MRRTYEAVLAECHVVLTELHQRHSRSWKRVVQTLKSAALSHEGDEEAKQDQLFMGHCRRKAVSGRVKSHGQETVAASSAVAPSTEESPPIPPSQPGLLHGNTFHDDDQDGDDTPAAPLAAPAPAVAKDDAPHAPWFVYLAQNLSKV